MPRRKLTTAEFIAKARVIHGDKYDYSKVEYKGAHTDIIIICPEHGEFLQTPSNHLLSGQGHGCTECGRLRQTLSQEERVAAIQRKNPFIEVLGSIVNARTKVPYRCRICGHKWDATPHNLEHGRGCTKCAKSGFSSHDYGNLYIMVDDLEVPTMMKIGVSIDPEKRRNQLLKRAEKVDVRLPGLHVVKTWSGSTKNMLAIENALHQAFSSYKISFPTKFDGSSEFFYYKPEVFEMVEKLLTQA